MPEYVTLVCGLVLALILVAFLLAVYGTLKGICLALNYAGRTIKRYWNSRKVVPHG